MQLRIGFNDILAQPGSLFVDAQLAAVADDAVEVAVDGNLLFVFAQQGAHGVGDMYLVGEDDETLVWTIPHGLVIVAE